MIGELYDIIMNQKLPMKISPEMYYQLQCVEVLKFITLEGFFCKYDVQTCIYK